MAKPEPFLALVHKKSLFNTSLNGPPKNTSPESFLVGTGALSSFTLLVSSTARVSLCSLQCSLRHSTLSSTSKNFKPTLKVQIFLQQLVLCSSQCKIKNKNYGTRNMQLTGCGQVMWSAVFYQLWYISTTKKLIMAVQSIKHRKLNIFCIKVQRSERIRWAGPA